MEIHEKLRKIQNELQVPKSHHNQFGNFYYRSAEDILDAIKPFLEKYELTLTISDNIVYPDGRFYVEAKCTLTDGDKSIIVNAYAREQETKKGMDESQITGSASSYARKYALNGLFLIDDSRDADTQDNRDNGHTNKPVKPESKPQDSHGKGWVDFAAIFKKLDDIHDKDRLDEYKKEVFEEHPKMTPEQKTSINNRFESRKKSL
jgi:hypothetical protein